MDTAFQCRRMHLNKLLKVKDPESYQHGFVRKAGTADKAQGVMNVGTDGRYPIPSAH